MGIRTEVSEMWAVGTMNEDYLGYLNFPIELNCTVVMLTHIIDPWRNRLRPYEGVGKDGRLDMLKAMSLPSAAGAFATVIQILGIQAGWARWIELQRRHSARKLGLQPSERIAPGSWWSPLANDTAGAKGHQSRCDINPLIEYGNN